MNASTAAVVDWYVIRPSIFCTLLAALLLAGCHTAPKTTSDNTAGAHYKTYQLRGKIVSTDPAKGEVTVAHQAIPGFMEAMTMPYKVKDPNILSDLHSGDVITADLFVSQGADADVFLDHIDVIAEGKPDYRPTSIYHVPAPGDEVPNFALRNQDGRTISFHQFHGKELLVTFIYTRCPLPNFCPLVTRNFATISSDLKQDPALYKNSHLLCISFDPEHDTPARLRAYGAEYIGSDAKDAFTHLEFAVPPNKAGVDKLAKYFDVGLTYGPDSSITHTLSTTLIGADGKVIQFYPGNDWTVEQILSDMKKAAPRA